MDEGDEHGMGLMGLENGCGDDGKWARRVRMDPMGTERWALFVKWVWKGNG